MTQTFQTAPPAGLAGARLQSLGSRPVRRETTAGPEPLPSSAGSGGAGGSDGVVRVRSLFKHFRREDGSTVPAVDQVSLDVQPGEFLVLLGPSGCGKTTLLRCIAGLEQPDAGSIHIHGKPVFDSAAGLNVPTERRRISMIFQSYALWPHLDVFENVAYPLRARRVAKDRIAHRVHEVLGLVGVPDLTQQYPAQMSGGQQQRVALARAIVAEDDLVLFDEPLSNVDAKVRETLRIELLEMQQRLRFAAIYVTHDQTEAMALAHRVAVMRAGRAVQVAPPREVYRRPVTRYVANFVGATNELVGRVLATEADTVHVRTSLGEVAAVAAEPFAAGTEVAVVFRPERCRLHAQDPGTGLRWPGLVQAVLFLGPHTEYVIAVGPQMLRVWSDDAPFDTGAAAWVSVAPEDVRAVSLDSPSKELTP
ncbi:MAG TPA: ABC transporter ATP-binding protein [Ramlibacter sp.]|nr:ABC transporter ATP-binding protein [Ramlibacter sp.]